MLGATGGYGWPTTVILSASNVTVVTSVSVLPALMPLMIILAGQAFFR